MPPDVQGDSLKRSSVPVAQTDLKTKSAYSLSGVFGVILLMVVPTLLRFLLIGRFDLDNDEAHYYMYAVHPDFSFFDHPLMIGLLVSKGMEWWGQTELGVRFFAPVLFLLSSILLAMIAWRLLPDGKFVLTVLLLLNAVPLFGLLGATLMLPDDPLSVFWLLYLLVLLNGIRIFPRATWVSKLGIWSLLGLIFGLALLSKYNGILLPAITLGIMASQKTLRPFLREPWPWAGLALGFAFAWPLFYWNWMHGEASFLFQARHGLGPFAFKWVAFYQMVLGQIGYISPILWVLIIISLFSLTRLTKKMGESPERLSWIVVLWFAAGPLVFFNLIGLVHPILPHWPALGYMSGLLVLGYTYHRSSETFQKWVRAGAGLGFAMTVLVLLQVTNDVLVLPASFPHAIRVNASYPFIHTESRPVPPWVDITNDLFGYKRLAHHLSEEGDTDKTRWAFFDSDHFNTSDELAFYLHAPEKTLCLTPEPTQFDYWTSPSHFLGTNGIFISTDKYPTDPRKLYPPGTFRNIIPETPYPIYRNGRLARIFYVYRLIHLERLPWTKGAQIP